VHLVWLELTRYRRFESCKVNLDGRVIALVGPNEAGKTSLLTALAHLSNENSIATSELTRGTTTENDDNVVEASFFLSDEDLKPFESTLRGQRPRWLKIGKRRGGSFYADLEPRPTRDITPRHRLAQVLAASDVADLLADTPDTERLSLIAAALDAAQSDRRNLQAKQIDALRALQSASTSEQSDRAERLRAALDDCIRSETSEDPGEAVRQGLFLRRPRFVVFAEQDRILASEYDLSTLPDPAQPSLRNLAALAGLNLTALRAAVQQGDTPQVATLEEAANKQLREFYGDAWRQSKLSVQFRVEGTILRFLVRSDAAAYTSIADRSDGLRAFVALTAFCAQQGDAKLILLIDEAEAHLHYDAQADLIRMLSRQRAAIQVVYTTHSVGALPQDLGTGIRVVERGAEQSTVTRSFWTQGAGFTPLLLGIGATILAFTPARYAVVAEGASDAILLPSMLRATVDREELPFQVVPGLAELSDEGLSKLDAEAGRVAYLVDGDDAGTRLKRRLEGVGVPARKIVELPKSKVIEDLLAAEAYVHGFNRELEISGREPRLAIDDLPASGRPAFAAQWCQAHGIEPPNKTAVASRIAEGKADISLIDDSTRADLISIFRALDEVLSQA